MYKVSIYNHFPDEMYEESVLNKVYKYLYHGSLNKYDVLKPWSLDYGNAFQKPGWSIFTYTKKDYCVGWCVFKWAKAVAKKYEIPYKYNMAVYGRGAGMLQETFDAIIQKLKEIPNTLKLFYIYTIKVEDDFVLGLGHSSNTPSCITIRGVEVKPYKIEKMIMTEEILRKHTTILTPEDIQTVQKMLKIAGINARLSTPLMRKDNMYDWKYRRQIMNAANEGIIPYGDNDALEKFINDNHIEFRHPSISDRIHLRV